MLDNYFDQLNNKNYQVFVYSHNSLTQVYTYNNILRKFCGYTHHYETAEDFKIFMNIIC